MSKRNKKTEDAPVIEVEEIETAEVIEETPEIVEEVVEPVVEEIIEVVEPVVEEVVEPVVVASVPASTPEHTLDGWWNEIGSRLNNRGYGNNTIIRRAQKAFGAGFDNEKYTTYISESGVKTLEEKVKAVWNSQK